MSAGHKVVVTSTLRTSSGLGRKESGQERVPGVRRGLLLRIAERSPGYKHSPLSAFQAECRCLILPPSLRKQPCMISIPASLNAYLLVQGLQRPQQGGKVF